MVLRGGFVSIDRASEPGPGPTAVAAKTGAAANAAKAKALAMESRAKRARSSGPATNAVKSSHKSKPGKKTATQDGTEHVFASAWLRWRNGLLWDAPVFWICGTGFVGQALRAGFVDSLSGPCPAFDQLRWNFCLCH